MRSRYKGGAARAAALAALGVSGALLAQSLNPQSQSLTPRSPNPQTLSLSPGNYQLVMTTQVLPQAAAASSAEVLTPPQPPQMHFVCIGDSAETQSRDSALAQARELAGQGDRSCRLTQLSSSGNRMSFVLQCAHSTIRFDGLLAANSYRATLLTTSDQGQKTTINLTARRTGNCNSSR
jgi:hypothetical protein